MTPEQTRFEILKSVFLDERTKELLAKVNDYTLGAEKEAGFRIYYDYWNNSILYSELVEGNENSISFKQAKNPDTLSQTILTVHSHTRRTASKSDHWAIRFIEETKIEERIGKGEDVSVGDLVALAEEFKFFILFSTPLSFYTNEKDDLYQLELIERFIPPIEIRLYPLGIEQCNLYVYQFSTLPEIKKTNQHENGKYIAQDLIQRRIMIGESVAFYPDSKTYAAEVELNDSNENSDNHEDISWLEKFAKASASDLDRRLFYPNLAEIG